MDKSAAPLIPEQTRLHLSETPIAVDLYNDLPGPR